MGEFTDYVTNLRKQICASLYLKPATLEELCTREFLANHSVEGIDRILFHLENDGWVYFKYDKYRTYKSTVRKHLQEHELE